jgi:hypothetical protein
MFALRAIGLVLLARWLFSMSTMDLFGALSAMASSPWACINLVFLFLLIFLPGAKARAERPFHPLPQWLRQALRLFAFLGFLFAAWSIGAFVWAAGWKRTVNTVAATNGWLIAAPALYAIVAWLCRPRALWRTNVAARRFAIGRYAVSIDVNTRTAVVWAESRKVGQYDARELSVSWPEGERADSAVGTGAASVAGSGATGASDTGAAATPAAAPAPAEPTHADNTPGEPTPPVLAPAPAPAPAEQPAVVVVPPSPRIDRDRIGTRDRRHQTSALPGFANWRKRPLVELTWDSPAAGGHNHQTVFRAPLVTEGDRVAARALDSSLQQVV